MTPIIVLTTLPDPDSASRLADALLERRLAACVAVGAPQTSVYRWKGAIERSTEIPLTIKSLEEHRKAIEMLFSELHPYEIPELLVLPIAGAGAAYLGWMAEELA
jgi:periplasmic divalent cation tolerance protein